MDTWPPEPDDDDERPGPDEGRTLRERDRFSEAVGDAWESGLQRDRYPDTML